jgi:uncharacterized membrane protein
MNKKLAHTILFVGNILSVGVLWLGFHELNRISNEINLQQDSIRFANRTGFCIVAIGYLLIYIGVIVEQFRPDLIKKYKQFLNYATITMVITLLAAGFIGSSWIKANVENAGYTYCHNASGISALSRTLVYTKNMDICEELVETERKR